MATEQEKIAQRGARLWLDVATVGGLNDAELIHRFLTEAGSSAHAAFAAMVARHGSMVLRTCHAILRDGHDVDDAFQATFLVLVRRCRTLRVGESLAPWLHRVASRVALRAQVTAARRRRHEQQAAASRVETCEGREPHDFGPILHAEIDRLPERYRGPVVLCDLEGLTHEGAAEQIGCPVGTVKSRLARARERLRLRLTRRGILPASGGLGALFPERSASAVAPALAQATASAASRFAESGQPAAGTVPVAVTLAQGVVNAMYFNKMAKQIALLLIGAFLTTGALVLAADRPVADPTPPLATTAVAMTLATPAAPTPGEPRLPAALQPFQGCWTIEKCDSSLKGFGAEPREARKWRWTVLGEVVTWGRQGEEWNLFLKVDPARKPMAIDLTYLNGPFKDEKCLGIFEWGGDDGKTLCISIQDPGAGVPRPKDFSMTEKAQNSLIFLRKTEPVDAKKELAALQGTWTFDIVQTEAWPKPIGKGPDQTGQGSERKWIVKGNELTWISPDSQVVKVSFTIDPNKVPRHIDMTFLSGPSKGEKCMGVYEWGGVDGKRLHLCMVDPASKAPRPKNISFETNGERSLIKLAPQ